jgi:hypothetical protein
MSVKQTIESCIDVPFMDLRNISELMMSYTPFIMPETIVVITIKIIEDIIQGEVIYSIKKHKMTYEKFKLIVNEKPELINKICNSGLTIIDLIDKNTNYRYFRIRGNFDELNSYIETLSCY